MGKGTRTAAGVVGALLFLAGVAAGVAVWRSRQPGAAVYRTWLQGVPTSETADWNTGDTACPASGRGVGPIGADDRAVPKLAPGDQRQQIGAGQFLAYHVRIDADPLAQPSSDLTADLVFSSVSGSTPVDLSAGIVCAFVDDGDPLNTSLDATAEVSSSTLAEDTSRLAATLDVKAIEAGTSTVVEIWLKAAAEQPRSTSVFQATLDGVEASLGGRARVMASTARLVTNSKQSRDLEIELVGPDAVDLQPGQDVQLTMRVSNPAEDAVGRDVVARFTADPTLVLNDITISDEAGAATTCDLAGGVVTCTAPYLVPGERITVLIEGTLAADAPRVFGGSGPACAPKAQDLCVTAALGSSGSASSPERQVELAIDLPAPDFIAASKLPADDSADLYVGRPADFLYVIAAGTDEPINAVTVVDPSCAPITFVSGDDGADAVLGPGEQWTYRCSALVDQAQAADVTVNGTTASGQPAMAVTRLAAPVLDPGVSIATLTVRDGSAVQVVNTGSSELTGIVVAGRECGTEVDRGDTDDDGVLDPGERWILPCRSSSGTVRVYGTDPGGGAVTAFEE